ncbi:WD40 repeat protein [Plasmopara halstedii]|uniref:WD40 repeat protein n=1 Tax=Plasmopara halstedii TaxID=4781 RepID=A0A0P1AIJ5_PLAHL|nr:WD40 repeat protein [Plasmopara halstedii]CEG40362.1 WD40 repeat protein [Plasmopara halstedii]|eukprot:XP_024576731.1 WD40 repeat protein [Plasmopara halstedii]
MTTNPLSDNVLLLGSSETNELLVVDASNGSRLFCFKNCRSAMNGVHVVPRTNHLVGVQEGKLALHLWNWGKDMPVFKCHVAEKMGPITSSTCGNILFAGATSGKVYVWDIKTGELVTVFDAHYKRVSALALTSDDSHLITAGEDALVHVWRLVDLLDEPDIVSSFQQGVTPIVSFTDHVLPITSLHVGLGDVNARIYTSSLDRTCKIWSLHSSQCLFSVSCPSYVNTCIADPMEQRLFMGCGNGEIYTLDLNAAATIATAATARVANASRNLSSTNGSPWGSEALLPDTFQGHETSVTMLQVHSSGAFLISGDEAGVIHIWDSISRQSLRTIKFFKGKITALVLLRRPRNLLHQEKMPLYLDSNDLMVTPLPVAPLKKYMNTNST